ncbi:MAG: hypothetical protein IJX56_04665 [Alistipes sp.]|nr:hypothetical protein [Alistipes sp.]
MQYDTEFNPQSEEERLAAEREAELARRIRREVRRIQRGEADQELQAEQEEEEREQEALREARAQEERKNRSPLRGLVTGNILRQEWLTVHYRYPLLIAGVFLVSIVVIFWSLSLDMTYTRVEREVQLLRERAVRLKQERSLKTSHSAIVEQVRERGLGLQDPVTPNEIIE